jgi:putative transposase
MGIAVIYPRPNTNRPGIGQRVYLYILRYLIIDRPNQVGRRYHRYPDAKEICLTGSHPGWYSRRILCGRISNCLDSTFCVEALQEVVTRYVHQKSSTLIRYHSLLVMTS